MSTPYFLENVKAEAVSVQFDAATEYSVELLQNLNVLFADDCLCDVGLVVCPGRLIRAHRCVLSAASPYFHAMLTGGLRESRLDVIDMQAVGASHVIEKLLAFIYTGLLSVHFELLFALRTPSRVSINFVYCHTSTALTDNVYKQSVR